MIGVLALPWVVLAAAVVLALVATYAALATRAGARKVSIVAAISGARRRQDKSTAPHFLELGCSLSHSPFSRTQGAPAAAPATPEHPNSYSGLSFSSRRWSFSPRAVYRSLAASVDEHPSRSGSRCATSPATAPGQARARGDQSRGDDRGSHHRHRRCSLRRRLRLRPPNLASNQLIVGRTPNASLLSATRTTDAIGKAIDVRQIVGSKGQLPISSTRRRPSRPSAAMRSPSQRRSFSERSGSIHLRSTRTPKS